MQDIIAITKASFNGAEVNSANARDIHKYLEVGTPFSMWINRAIKRYAFQEGEDFTIHKNVNGKVTYIDFIVTIDMAKELCMIDNSTKGRETRRYFLDIEKENKSITSELQAIQRILNVSMNHEKRIETIEQNSRLTNQQECALIQAKNEKVYELANGDEQLIRKFHRSVWSVFKKKFTLPRYNELTTGQFNDGIAYIRSISLADLVI